MEIGSKIAYYRKNANITQDALARQLGISNQAVSKWETDQSYPDIELLPKIADIFNITLDELFGRNILMQQEDFTNKAMWWQNEEVQKVSFAGAEEYYDYGQLPWNDNDTLHVVLFRGQRMIRDEVLKERFGHISKNITFKCRGEVLNIDSCFSVICENVQGNVTAGSYVECGDIGHCVTAGNYVECGDVGGSVTTGNYVDCGDVGGSVNAGSYVDCGDVGGNVSAKENVDCGDVGGEVIVEGRE